MTAPTALSWFVVVPVRGRPEDKSRLHPHWGERTPELAAAMAQDTVTACLEAVGSGHVIVVTQDSAWLASLLRDVALVADPGRGLDAAVRAGGVAARDLDRTCAVAVVLGDHPALHPVELPAALGAAAHHSRALVVDDAGTGTALLTAAPGMPLEAAFGTGSAERHQASGHVPLDGRWPGLRLDVDDVVALAAAERLGVGARTARVLRGVQRRAGR